MRIIFVVVALLAGCDKQPREFDVKFNGLDCRKIARTYCGIDLMCRGGEVVNCANNVVIRGRR